MKTPGRSDKPRGGNGKFVKSGATAARDADAVRLRTRGLTYDQIAGQLGFSGRQAAFNAVQRALAATLAEPAAEMRRLEAERLDDLVRHLGRVLASRHLVVGSGKVAVDPATGEPLRDYGPRSTPCGRSAKDGPNCSASTHRSSSRSAT